MNNCQRCADLLLDYLYDLLDESDVGVVQSHLDACDACRSRLGKAQSQQRLIARAARLYQHVPGFLPPAPTPVQLGDVDTLSLHNETLVELPVSPPRPRHARPTRHLGAWLTLAASVLVLLGLGLHYYQNERAALEQALETARRDSKLIDAEYSEITGKYSELVQALPKKQQARELHLQVAGPAVYNPNAENSFYVATNSLSGKPVSSDVSVCVSDADSGKVLYQHKTADNAGHVNLKLPPNLADKAGSKLNLSIEANSVWSCEKIDQALMVAPPNYVTQIVTSKPAYEMGELLFFRTLTLEQFGLKPPEKPFQLSYSLVNSAGAVVKKLVGPAQANGIGGGEFAITEDLAEGSYSIVVDEVTTEGQRKHHFAPQSFPVVIQQPLTPKVALYKELLPGAKVDFAIQGGMNLANQPVTVTIIVKDQDGQSKDVNESRPEQLRVDAHGNAKGTVTVPSNIPAKALAELEVQIHDGKLNQKFVQSVPLTVPEWDAAFFPEGGKLVAGVPNRVYCQVTAATKTAALTGELLDSAGTVIATVALAPHQTKEHSHRLSGTVLLTPQPGQSYSLRVAAPDHTLQKPLPAASNGTLALTVTNPVAAESATIALKLHSNAADLPVLAVATCRGQVVAQQLALVQPQGTSLDLTPVAGTTGMVRVTVFQPSATGLVPLAERLVYRYSEKKLKLSFSSAQNKLAPGQKAELLITAEDEKEKAAKAHLLAMVVEEGAAHSKDSPAQLQLPGYFFLSGQVQHPADLDNMTVLLGPGVECAEALDRYLAIQGWRTFDATGDGKPATKAADPLSVVLGGDNPLLFCRDNLDAVADNFEKNLAQQTISLHVKLSDARAALQQKKSDASSRAHAAALALDQFTAQVRSGVEIAGGVALALLLLVAVVCFVVGLLRLLGARRSARTPFVAAFGSLLACFMLLGLASLFHDGQPDMVGPTLQVATVSDLPELPAAAPVLPDSLTKNPELPNVIVCMDAIDPPAKKIEDIAAEKKAGGDDKSKDSKGGAKTGSAGKGTGKDKEGKQQMGALTQSQAIYFQNKAVGPQFEKQLNPFVNGKNAQTQRFISAWQMQEQITQFYNPPQQVPDPTKSDPKPTPKEPTQSPINPPGGGFGGKSDYPFPVLPGDVSNYARQYAFENAQTEFVPSDTLLWAPDLTLNKGKLLIQFDLPSYSASYRVFLIGHDALGRLGYAEGSFKVQAK